MVPVQGYGSGGNHIISTGISEPGSKAEDPHESALNLNCILNPDPGVKKLKEKTEKCIFMYYSNHNKLFIR